MTWYPDLSPYTYLPDIIPADQVGLNVGWLAPGHDFPVGDPPAGFVDALADLHAEHAQVRTRGWHQCGFCEPMDFHSVFSADTEEKKLRIGNAEIRVVSEAGIILSAPTLVLHYVDRHRYLPPAEFTEAVLARRIAPDPHA